jgi:tetratricopeptide (TPR) repeat protein
MKPHAFVAMPFGTKPDADGRDIDFNRVFAELLRPALEAAGCEVFRADNEQRAGDIRTDMFQELLAADLVLADLTIDNPNVWYELGVRHALRARGVVLVQGPRKTSPFDIYTDRKVRYSLKDGAPDPATLEADRASIAAMARATLEANTRRKVSPVYTLLPHLQQPEWQQLLMSSENEFGAAHREWKSRMEVARRKLRVGDILVLAGETPVRALAIEARFAAGKALLQLGQPEFALEQFDEALRIDPDHLKSQQQRAVCLGRLGRIEEAREAVSGLCEAHPKDAESWALAGRVEKDAWTERFRLPGGEMAAPGSLKAAAAEQDVLLGEAIEPYRKAFLLDPSHYYSGINAFTLNVLRSHLKGAHDAGEIDDLFAGLRWSLTSAFERESSEFWARASWAEAMLVSGDKRADVIDAWKMAVAKSNKDWFALDSARQTLVLLLELGFRLKETEAALEVVDAEIARLKQPFVPRQVILFSGHMVDGPSRPKPRFPQAKVAAATEAIARELDAMGVGPGDLALTQGAAGGDLIFTELAQARGVRVQWMQPVTEPEFIEASIMGSAHANEWRERYYAAKAKMVKESPPRCMPAELGPLPKGVDKWERGNLWLLYTMLAHGPDKARCVCLWNGEGGDGPGGTKHMQNEVSRRTGRVSWVDTREL